MTISFDGWLRAKAQSPSLRNSHNLSFSRFALQRFDSPLRLVARDLITPCRQRFFVGLTQVACPNNSFLQFIWTVSLVHRPHHLFLNVEVVHLVVVSSIQPFEASAGHVPIHQRARACVGPGEVGEAGHNGPVVVADPGLVRVRPETWNAGAARE